MSNLYSQYLKRIVDLIIVIPAFIITSPIFTICLLIQFIAYGSKPFFIQMRPGKNAKLFPILKFKTMTDEKNEKGDLLPDNKRITKLGKIFRSLSLDELPQLLNVMNGDMSLVGPRPLLPKYLPLYNKEQSKRHDVKPGITGLAQVSGRNTISWDERLKFDIQYVENQSFLLDVKILWISFKRVIFRENINLSDSETMKPFKGSTE